MRYLKKKFSLSLAILLILSLTLGSLVMAEGQNIEGSAATEPVNDNSCPQYSSNRDHIIANHSNIVVNGDGTATVSFQTTQDCVRVSFSSYAGPADWVPGPNDTTIPYQRQIHFDGQSIIYPEAGSYSITINIPACLPYQLDIYSGDLIQTLGVGGHGNKIKAWKLKLANTCTGVPTPTPETTPTPTPTPTVTPTPENTPTPTPTVTPTPENTPTPTPTVTPTPENTPTPTPTITPTPENTPTPTPTVTPTPENTPTPTPTITPTPETTPRPTPTVTPTPENTPTPTPTPETTTIVDIDDEDPPVGGIDEGQDTVIDVAEEQVPLDTLPKTGDSSPIPYYLIGAFALTAGFLSLRKQRQRR